jgi:hypothetical protein
MTNCSHGRSPPTDASRIHKLGNKDIPLGSENDDRLFGYVQYHEGAVHASECISLQLRIARKETAHPTAVTILLIV